MLACVACVSLLLLSGCRDETPTERAEREARAAEAEKRRLDEEASAALVRFGAARAAPSPLKGGVLAVKPGHWASVDQPVEAGREPFEGQLAQRVVDPSGTPATVAGTRYAVAASRPLLLAGAAKKSLKTPLLVPAAPRGSEKPPRLRLTTALRSRQGTLVYDQMTPIVQLADHQYSIVVLASDPTPYGYLDSLRVVDPGTPFELDIEALGGTRAQRNYRVVGIRAGSAGTSVGLAESPFEWTSIAYVVWDQASPDALNPAQRRALIDWVTWGGTLLVSGPGSLDALRGSFLEPLLPAKSLGVRQLGVDDLAPLRREWGVGAKRASDPLARAGLRWSGVELAPTKNATSPAGLGGLVVERRFGRGRVVVTAMGLAEPGLVNWRGGFENFVNNALLRRPPRAFGLVAGSDGATIAAANEEDQRPVATWRDAKRPRFDASANTPLRLFVRDSHARSVERSPSESDDGQGFSKAAPALARGGYAAWDDDSPVARAARDVLRESAGIATPGASFVLGCLVAYLVLLVPMNWLFFYALGRLEGAWVAAPLIAVLGGIAVTRQTQLDIGFVRSQVEVAVLETQPDSPRGVLTRFTALYSSLATTHEVEFSGASAVAAPFAPRHASEAEPGPAVRPITLTLERQERTRLRGLFVASASTELLRSEELLDVAAMAPEGSSGVGRVVLGRAPDGSLRIENYTRWRLQHVAVVERPEKGPRAPRLAGCWIGDLGPGAVSAVAFLPIETTPSKVGGVVAFAAERSADRSEEAATRTENTLDGSLDLAPIESLALDPREFERGERRVVARIAESLAGIDVTPRPSQRRGATLLVGRLSVPPPPEPLRDANTPFD
ncbi:MAG: hypothetical protein ACRCT8_06990 [Lacipirellulaceae bacterium]